MTLSKILWSAGFVRVAGTSECILSPEFEERIVERGTPHTFNDTNGVLVVYDQYGRPWVMLFSAIAQRHSSPDTYRACLASKLGLTQDPAAYVPHAQDLGDFLSRVAPGLRRLQAHTA